MAYGLTFEQVTHVNRPIPVATSWGSVTRCTESKDYALYRFALKKNAIQPLHFHPLPEGCIFVESGDIDIRYLDADGGPRVVHVNQHKMWKLPPHAVYGMMAHQATETYFIGPGSSEPLRFVPVETDEAAIRAVSKIKPEDIQEGGWATNDVREKYWGRIETILNSNVAGKRLFVRRGCQSSLEFHVEKRETYWIQSGRLKVGLRIGRAENRSIQLEVGESYDIFPGVMHMRIALEDTVIIEASTRDTDADSFLVEDGETYRHVER